MVANMHQEFLQIPLMRSYGRRLQAAHLAQMIREKIEFNIYGCLRLVWDGFQTAIFSEKVLHLPNGSGSIRPKVTIVLPGRLKGALTQIFQPLSASLLEIGVNQPRILELISHGPNGEATIVRPRDKLVEDGAKNWKGKVTLIRFWAKRCNHLNLLSK